MTAAPPSRDEVVAILAAHFARTPEALEGGASFSALGVDSVAVVDGLFALEERLGRPVPFAPADADGAGMEAPVRDLIDRIMSDLGGFAPDA